MESIILFSGSSFVFFLFLTLFASKLSFPRPEERVLRSLGRISIANEIPKENRPFKERLIKPVLHSFISLFSRSKKDKNESTTDLKLSSAGLSDWNASEWKVLRYAAGLFGTTAGIAFCFLFNLAIFYKLEAALIGLIVGCFLPDYWLKTKIKKRKDEIERSLPDVLDLVMVSVEAGLGFDAALLKVVEKQKGVLAEEFSKVLQEIKMGRPRRDALKDLAKRNNVEDLSNVIASLVQADQLGISMGGVLRNQSRQLRQKRRQRAEEQAQKAPVKIIIPLVLFIFPCIFIVTLGPAIIRIMDFLANR